MKRSKMVEILENELNPGLYQDYKYTTSEISDALAALEKAGMLPPTIRYDSIGEYEDIKNTEILHDYDISFAWEPEDETI